MHEATNIQLLNRARPFWGAVLAGDDKILAIPLAMHG